MKFMCKNKSFQSSEIKNKLFKGQGWKTKLMYNLGTKTIFWPISLGDRLKYLSINNKKLSMIVHQWNPKFNFNT